MEDTETARMRKYGESKTTRIMMATVLHVTSGLGLRKFQADGCLLTRVYLCIVDLYPLRCDIQKGQKSPPSSLFCTAAQILWYICYAQRSKTLIGRKKWPQRVVALEKELQREMSCFWVFFKQLQRVVHLRNNHNALWLSWCLNAELGFSCFG